MKKVRNRLVKTLLLVSPESAAMKIWETFLICGVPHKMILFLNMETFLGYVGTSTYNL